MRTLALPTSLARSSLRLTAFGAVMMGVTPVIVGAQQALPGERASHQLLRSPAEGYELGTMWQVPAELPAQTALRASVVDGLRALPLSKAPSAHKLLHWIEGLPITGRAVLGSADARWLEVNESQDPRLHVGQTLNQPLRPRTVTVVLEDGQLCRVPARSGALAFDYLRGCMADAEQRDVVWIAQPNGRTYRYGTGLWNGQAQEPPAAGAWIWAPARAMGMPTQVSDALIRFLATQGVASDKQGYSVPSAIATDSRARSAQQQTLPVTASDWGEIGLLQTPTARMAPAGDMRAHISHTWPYTRINVMFQPLDWVEFGFRYVDVSNQLYGPQLTNQSYKDKSLDVKVRLWEESRYLPGIAAGVRDLGGTGLFSGEYVVASKRTGSFDWSLGMGWGYLGARGNIKNPLSFLSDRFTTRPNTTTASGGTLSAQNYFRGPSSLFGGVQWQTPIDPLILKLEYDGNSYQREPFGVAFSQRLPFNAGAVYRYSPGIDVSAGLERGNKVMLGITFHGGLDKMQSPKPLDAPMPAVQRAYPTAPPTWSDTTTQIERETGWRIAQMRRQGNALHVTVSGALGLYRSAHFDRLVAIMHRDAPADVGQFVIEFAEHDLQLGRKTVDRADWVTLHTEGLSPAQQRAHGADIPTAPLQDTVAAPSSTSTATVPEWRSSAGRLSGGLSPSFWQSLGGPDSFMLYQLGIQGSAEYRITGNTWVNAAGNLRVIDNYDKFKYTAPSNLPRVRTYAREYVTTSRFTLGTLQLTHAEQWGQNHFVSVYGGLLESMFGGVGAEYLYRPLRSNWALGVDMNHVRQRDFDQRFTFRDYSVNTGHATLYWNTGWNDVNVRLSAGQYLAGDKGATLDLSRRFDNGVTIGAYATKTNVSAAQFGEGSFDKGIYVSFPFDAILPRSTSTTGTIFWSPLTRDGGARLARTQTLFYLTSPRATDAFTYGPPSDGRLRTGDDIFTPKD